jgi:uncharacterized protein (DUF433 family)
MISPTTTTNLVPETVIPILGEYIVKTPETCGGEARVAGTRIKVRHIATWIEKSGQTPAEVVAAYPQLSRAAVHAALAYYWSHLDEIQQAIDREDKLVAEMKAATTPSKIQDQLAKLRGENDSLSPR